MANQATDFALIVGKTIHSAYIDALFQGILLRFTDESWYLMTNARDIDELIHFIHITNHQFLTDAIITSVDVIDALNVNITTSKGTTLFNAALVMPNFINGQLDVYLITDIHSYDDNDATRLFATSDDGRENKELPYKLLTIDF